MRHAVAMNRPADVPPAGFRHVLLPLDGSRFALAALPTARALCERFHAELVAISVAADERRARRLQRHARRALDGGRDNRERAEVVVGDDPALFINARVTELGSCVVCMSTRGRGRVAGAMIGSVARAVLQSSMAPMLAVGPQADRPPLLVGRPRRRPGSWPKPLSVRRLVACVDGSAASEAVLPVATQWAKTFEMSLTILTVAEDALALDDDVHRNRFGPPDPGSYTERLAARWKQIFADTVGEVVVDPVGVASGVRTNLNSRPAGLVAVTTHARTGAERLRLGAVAADVIRESAVPVLVVPLADGAADRGV
jgi:nucleotide-binding universal stress UspA family protein